MNITQLTHITEPDGVAPGTGYTQVVTGSGRLVAVSGQVALEYVGADRLPASTAVQVAALFRPELLLEVDAPAIVQR